MPVAIRSATLNDVPAIVAVERQAASAAHWASAQYGRLVDSGLVLVAELDVEDAGKLCGFICAQIVAGEWEIENVVVDGKFVRGGIGSELVGALILRARQEQASLARLEVRESNLAARRLYEKHGFREVGRRRLYYKVPEEDAILYVLQFER
jgi:[ribosomal protein S18]-alanine N-acetyltransferase